MPLVPRPVTVAALCALGLVLSACQDTDPLTRQRGDWKPAGVNQSNLAAELANPADMSSGVGDDGASADQSVAAIDRLRTDKVKPIEHIGLTIGAGGS